MNFLTIADFQASDIGTYVCTASNSAGQAMASANLIEFSTSDVVVMVLPQFLSPSSTSDCHELDTTQLEVWSYCPH